ncbi:HSPB1-associated protein 1 homolog isoform X2 [Haliotis rubra]|uniref:HSPB1-associated protein 1 homolog isoform X2 n=1 Tax=Haliotis rubra TaxID=36100 RepID=UPI001EE58533|nr:HSPB1-associated protein 1 homolog isoform X2 [Haliotis rubra]
MAREKTQSNAELLRQTSCPVVFTGLTNQWSSLNWTPSHLAQVLQGKTYRCKIAPRKSNEKVWETDCAHIEASLADFTDWTAGNTRAGNPLHHVSLRDFSCYVDYKYMSDMFEDCSDLLKSVDWSVFGLSGRDGKDSTIWIGSEGASTPCHYDTYGYNLVAQIHGRKRWHLFPPSSTEALYPTRLPYEESSVFSEVNVGQPDLGRHPRFKESQAVVVTLEPGQVLYVPCHWWHYVECLQTAISINTWVELPSDDECRLSESVTRATISCLVNSDAGAHLEHWINPGEQIMPMDVNLTYLAQCLRSQADKSANDYLEARGVGSKDNLHSFLQHFKTRQFDVVHAPWHIPGGASIVKTLPGDGETKHDNRDMHLDDQALVVGGCKRHSVSSVEGSNVEMKNVKRKTPNQKCTDDIPDVVPNENIDDENLVDKKKARLVSGDMCVHEGSVQGTCGIFVLQPSCFDTYFNTVHKSSPNMVCGLEAADIQDIGDEDSVSLAMTHHSVGDTQLPEACASGQDSVETQHSVSVAHNDSSDLSAIKEIFFKSLLHPRVMKAFEEELTKNYMSLMK